MMYKIILGTCVLHSITFYLFVYADFYQVAQKH